MLCKDEKGEVNIPGHNHFFTASRAIPGCAACEIIWSPKMPKRIKSVYIIGSLRNPEVVKVANAVQAEGIEAFCDWYSPGPEADDFWLKYSKERGLTYKQALQSAGARNIFEFDKSNLDSRDAAVMVAPAGKSGHLELGYTIGKGKPGYILYDKEPERWDVMVQFATGVFFSIEELLYEIKEVQNNGNTSK